MTHHPFLKIVAGTDLTGETSVVPSRASNLPIPATVTGKNQRLRLGRREAWRKANRVMNYWRARLDWHSALHIAQRHGVGDASSFPDAEAEDRTGMLEIWRTATVSLMLTPAPDLGSVTWKKAALARGAHDYANVKAERIERVIADDLAFLAAHPVRRPRAGRA